MIKQIMFSVLFSVFAIPNAIAATTAPATTVATKPTILQVIEKKFIVNGKPSKVFDIVQPDGTFGYYGIEGKDFDVIVENKTTVPTVLHWHGILSPNPQDGVPYVTQLPIPPNGAYRYKFKLKQAGTYWLHSHYKLQEQRLMAAPLIIHKENPSTEKEVLMFVQDFTYTDPKIIYADLRKKLQQSTTNSMPMKDMKMNGMQMKNMKMNETSKPAPMNMSGMKMSDMKMGADVTDVKFDAYLTNHKTLQNPDVIQVMENEEVLLRIINGSASSNYFVDLGNLSGTLVAVDAEPIKPITGKRFQMAIGNRLDIRVRIPQGEGAYPILALPEGTKQQTGLVLATTKATLPKLSEFTQSTNALLNYDQELKLEAQQPLPTLPVKQTLDYILRGDMQTYRWTINDQEWPRITPYKVKPNERIELLFDNKSMMSHPMHLHGHIFQITEINGKKITSGRKGDTVNVMPNSSMKVVLDTENPGIWMLHCHILYHQIGGMMTTVNYEGYPDRFITKQRIEGEKLYYISPK